MCKHIAKDLTTFYSLADWIKVGEASQKNVQYSVEWWCESEEALFIKLSDISYTDKDAIMLMTLTNGCIKELALESGITYITVHEFFRVAQTSQIILHILFNI